MFLLSCATSHSSHVPNDVLKEVGIVCRGTRMFVDMPHFASRLANGGPEAALVALHDTRALSEVQGPDGLQEPRSLDPEVAREIRDLAYQLLHVDYGVEPISYLDSRPGRNELIQALAKRIAGQ